MKKQLKRYQVQYRTIGLWSISIGLLLSCESGIRRYDFESRQFAATINIDSTRGLDSTTSARLMTSKAVYSFSEDGKGTNHVQMGMLSKDIPFTWKIEGDSLSIDSKRYAVQKQDMGFVLRSDSAKIILSKQP